MHRYTRDPLIRRLAILAQATVLLASVACDSRSAQQRKADGPEPIGYPSGPWWRGDINFTLLGAAHILVSHRDAKRKDQLLTIPGPAAARSPAEALALAQRIRAELKRAPERFADLASRYSDDPATAPLGGTIGEIWAPHLPNALVDALGNLEVGAASRVVESRLGYHIVKRFAVEPNETFDASQIVIAYAGIDALLRPERPQAQTRTREQARALAVQVRAMLTADPARFAALVREYSDSFEGLSSGDYGQRSFHDRNGEATPYHVLRRLQAGAISPPLDTPMGFRILRRDPVRERPTYALTALMIAFENARFPEGPKREAALAVARDVAARARRNPAEFDQLRQSYCDYDLCTQAPYSFKDGYWMFTAALKQIRATPIGELIAEPLETPLGFAIARRVDPAGLPDAIRPAENVQFELPRPKMPGLESASPAELSWYLGQLKEQAQAELKLERQEQEMMTTILDNLATSYASTPAGQRGQVTAEANLELAKVLGPVKAVELAQLNERLMRSVAGELDEGR